MNKHPVLPKDTTSALLKEVEGSKYKKFDVLFTLASLTFAVSKLCKTGRYPENVFAQFPEKRYLRDMF